MKKGPKAVCEEEADDWCFLCKDGGDLIICDHKGCLKVYHANCAGKKATSKKDWKCDRHTCFVCHKSAKVYCFCCPNAVCGRCASAAEFAKLREDGGFCDECVKLILLIEKNAEYDSDGEKLDFDDRDTRECLFKEYWEIIKEREELSMDHVYSADARLKKAKIKTTSRGRDSPIEFSDSEGTDGSASEDDENDEVKKPRGKRTYASGSESDDNNIVNPRGKRAYDSGSESDDRVKVKRPGVKQKISKSKFLEFEGWGSKPLICFLKSVGEDTTKELSRSDVDRVINKYIQENNLFHSGTGKRKRVHCDEKLRAIFRKKKLNRHMIYHLLEHHFVEMETLSEKDEKDGVCENMPVERSSKSMAATASKKQKSSGYKRKLAERMEVQKVPKVPKDPDIPTSCFAAINADNLKLVYLKKSYVEELLKQPETAEGKIVGSFVKVKGNPAFHISKSSYQLLQVTGLMQGSTVKANSENLLELHSLSKPVGIKLLSDNDLSEEEIEDLRERVENGLCEKLTVVDLQQKASTLHEDITKLSIEKELVLLQHLIDQANEKGWRREKYEYLARKAILQTPAEQERMLKRVPMVTNENKKLQPSVSPPTSDDEEDS